MDRLQLAAQGQPGRPLHHARRRTPDQAVDVRPRARLATQVGAVTCMSMRVAPRRHVAISSTHQTVVCRLFETPTSLQFLRFAQDKPRSDKQEEEIATSTRSRKCTRPSPPRNDMSTSKNRIQSLHQIWIRSIKPWLKSKRVAKLPRCARWSRAKARRRGTWAARCWPFTLLEVNWQAELYPPGAADLVGWLRDRGTTPIIAHPERHGFFGDDLERLRGLVAAGAWLQV